MPGRAARMPIVAGPGHCADRERTWTGKARLPSIPAARLDCTGTGRHRTVPEGAVPTAPRPRKGGPTWPTCPNCPRFPICAARRSWSTSALRRLRLPHPVLPRPRPAERAGLVAALAPDPERRFRPGLQAAARAGSPTGRASATPRRPRSRRPSPPAPGPSRRPRGSSRSSAARSREQEGESRLARLPGRDARARGPRVAGGPARGRPQDQRRRAPLQHACGAPPSPSTATTTGSPPRLGLIPANVSVGPAHALLEPSCPPTGRPSRSTTTTRP